MSPNKQQSTTKTNDIEILDNRNKQQESNSSKRKNGNAVTEANGQPIDNNKDRVNFENGKFLPAPTSIMDFILGMLTQIARRYLFIDAAKKAMAYLVVVVILSLIAEVFPISRDYYLVQKHNVLNRFGIKIGWFWTSLLLCPFMWLTSLLHHESLLKASFDQLRLLIATFAWYFWTNFFVKIEYQTGRCHGSVGSSRNDCYVDGGKWIPGFDISGHAFLLLYSILIITEEATSFRNWPIQPRVTAQHIPTRKDYDRFQQKTKFIQWNFVLLFALCLLWDFSLCVTALYYHNLIQKLIGASIAVFCWAGEISNQTFNLLNQYFSNLSTLVLRWLSLSSDPPSHQNILKTMKMMVMTPPTTILVPNTFSHMVTD